MRRLQKLAATSFFLTAFGLADALADIVDQEQLMTESTPVAIGGPSEQELAQSFTAGVDGFLTQIRIPVGCSSGQLIVEIQRLNADGEPSGDVVSSARVNAEDLPPPPDDFETITLSPPLLMNEGDRFAIVLKNTTGVCSILRGPEGDTYPDGQYFYDSRPNPPGWVGGKDRPAPAGTPGDMPFQTIVDDGSSGGSSNRCFGDIGSGPVPLPFTDDLPICRCLSEPILNEWRCRLLHPDFFIVRRTPLPPFNAQNDIVTEEWAFTPLEQLDGPVRVSIPLGQKQKPLIHEFGAKSQPGSFEFFKFERDIKDGSTEKLPVITLTYPMEGATSQPQKEFGFDPSFDQPAKGK